MTFRYVSVCSGIEAATVAWHPLGWTAAAFSEIEKFPRALLAHRFPTVPLHGDFTTIKGGEYGPVDLLVGGTPCQSFSIAGLRKGLADDRGNLALQFLALARRASARWVVWENVPGAISIDGGNALRSILDGMEDLGYIVDIDILDAQFHGVPQRRRRIFICGQHRDDLLTQRTDSSALTIAQCWLEILHGILVDRFPESASEPASSDSAFLSRDGVLRRMRLFGIDGASTVNFDLLQANLAEAYRRCAAAPRPSGAPHGDGDLDCTADAQSTDSKTAAPFTLTEPSLKSALVASCEVMRSYITSTLIRPITPAQIFTCSKAALLIARLIPLLNRSCPPWWSAASSALTAIEGFTSYARSASSDLFVDLERISAWRDFLAEAERASDALADIGIECFGQIFSVSESMCGHPPPRRKAGERVARPVASSSSGGSGYRNDADTADNLIAPTLGAEYGRKWGPDNQHIDTHGFPQAIFFSSKDHGADAGDLSPTLRAMGHDGSHANAGGQVAVAFHENQRHEFTTNDTAGSLKTSGGKPGQGYPAAMVGSAVRRLTPRECERLQGFPDDWTLIPYRGRPAADGPRYKAIGNSMAVPVMRWIGERLQAVEGISKTMVAA